MLIQFTVKNFRSFKEKATLSMVASNYDKTTKVNENIIIDKNFNLKLLKSAVVYGANASGKTKLFEVLMFMKHFVFKSIDYNNEEIPIEPFRLDEFSENEPSEFEVIFLKNKIMYRYGFELNKENVISEWLYYKPKSKEIEIFYKENGEYVIHNTLFKKGKKVYDEKLINNKALLLTVSSKFNDEISKEITDWFEKLIFINHESLTNYKDKTVKFYEKYQDLINSLIKASDIGINEILIEKNEEKDIPNEILKLIKKNLNENKKVVLVDIKTKHKVYDKDKNNIKSIYFSLNRDESSGTNKLVSISGTIIDALMNGYIVIIDELDSNLHPNLVIEIIKLFNSNEKNKKNAQLIFNTQNTNLLSSDLFRRDQIWFTDKNFYGESKLISLSDFKTDKVRKTDQFEESYLKGKYGGIPYLSYDEFKI